MTIHDTRLIAEADRDPLRVFWRKRLLSRRSEILAALEAWKRYFPRHSFFDLRLIQSPPSWKEEDEAAWRAAARAYHRDRTNNYRREQ